MAYRIGRSAARTWSRRTSDTAKLDAYRWQKHCRGFTRPQLPRDFMNSPATGSSEFMLARHDANLRPHGITATEAHENALKWKNRVLTDYNFETSS